MNDLFNQALVLSALTLIGLLGIIGYDLYTKRRERLVSVRKKTLGEAAEAIGSLARIAEKAAHDLRNERSLTYDQKCSLKVADYRAYYYGRAATIVRSIPVDRL